MAQYSIKITGSGTLSEIIAALQILANNTEADLAKNLADHGGSIELEDATLLTEISEEDDIDEDDDSDNVQDGATTPHSYVFDNQNWYTIVENAEQIDLPEGKFVKVADLVYYCDECKHYHIKGNEHDIDSLEARANS